MEVLGLTGGIGCGKSTVAQAFARRGVPVVDADRVAREVVMPGTDGLAEIVAAFGAGVLATDGSLDRAKLAAEVFGNDDLRRKLNAILHPRIAAASASHIAALADRYRWVLYDAALLVENDAWRAMAGLIVVTARTSAQRQRIVARDGLTVQEADARIAAQWPLARKLRIANWIVDNSGSRERLEARVAELYAEIVVKYGSPWIGPSRPSHSGG